MAVTGLTTEEVQERVSRGEVNSVEKMVSRSYGDIIKKNFFTTFNLILFALGAILVLLDEVVNAIAATGVIALNVIIATVQEIRAKRRLDKIALLLRPKVTVLRDGEEIEIDQSGIVKDDVVHLQPGDQALVDGTVLEMRYLEMNESLLTGESKTDRKKVGDEIYSGSFCVTGDCYYKVTAFGDDTYASKMLASARKYRTKATPLQMETAAITKALMSVALVFMAIMVIVNMLKYNDVALGFRATINMAVIIIDIVPIALFLLIVIAYMIASVRMADSGALLQNSSAVESLSHVDTVCMDKTGTITTNRLVFEDMHTFVDKDDAEECIRLFAGATGSRNRSIDALADRFGTAESTVVEEIHFSSERKFSAVRISSASGKRRLFLGALSALGGRIASDEPADIVASYSTKGLRSMIIAEADDGALYDDEEFVIPDLKPIAVIAIKDEVRPDCRETIDVFLKNGMDLKVISGDDPRTVNALFEIADIPGERVILSGEELDALEGQERTDAILRTNIFGRMKPDQKEDVIDTLKNNGRYVAMVGDGVNDVKSLKNAQVGVALQSGSGVARGVADMVLVNDNFAALPRALVEGKRTVSGMRDILKLYLSRNFVLAMMIALVFVFFRTSPFLPTSAAYYAFISVSIAAFLMTIWAEPSDSKEAVLPKVLQYAIPTAVMISIFGFITYAMYYLMTTSGTIDFGWTAQQLLDLGSPSFSDMGEMIAAYDDMTERAADINGRNAMLTFLVLAGITQMLIITPHFRFFSLDGGIHKDIKPTILVVLLYGLMILSYYVCATVPEIAAILGIAVFPPMYYLPIILMVLVWLGLTMIVHRYGMFSSLADYTEKWYKKRLDKAYSERDD